MTELYLPTTLYRELVERLVPVAGIGDTDQVRAVFGPLAKDRIELLAERLAHLPPCPACGAVTGNEIKVALGEVGDIWPRSIYGDVMVAHFENLVRH